ncbi:glycosyltransferase involved in cell wall biosynthesis [Microbacterium sp. BE35]|uniref:glycosyltransferase family 2 protein n=1 Tax=Microbacterium sp. BE35 TaxID=2817773 RepID=UPI00285C8E9E|nr:glycosyltransferase family 2 protein [Microbacterium sp. BE35]MDR7189102.1 glycosyltransferase involved in cell wall biosynthesis [Microbacterium sp. BE35]
MSSPSRVLIVMPAFNEEEAIGAVVREVRASLPGVRCVVVDDGSKDATISVAEAAGADVLRLPFNLGVGGAMRLGFKFAVENGFDAVVQIDSDGQHDPSAVPELLTHLDTADIVIGARFAGVGDYQAHGVRRFAMRIIAGVLSRTARTKLTDTTSGFKACGPRAIALFAENYPAEYLGDTIEALVIAARAGCRIVQVPVAMRVRAGGRPSHNPVKAAVYLMRAFLALGFAYLRPAPVMIERGAPA